MLKDETKEVVKGGLSVAATFGTGCLTGAFAGMLLRVAGVTNPIVRVCCLIAAEGINYKLGQVAVEGIQECFDDLCDGIAEIEVGLENYFAEKREREAEA